MSVKQIIGIVIALLFGGAIALYAALRVEPEVGQPVERADSGEPASETQSVSDVAATMDKSAAETTPQTATADRPNEDTAKAAAEAADARAKAEAEAALAKAQQEAAAKAEARAKAEAEAALAKAQQEAAAKAEAEARAKAEAEAALAKAQREAAAKAEAEARAKAEAEAALAKAQREAAAKAEAEARAKAEAEAALAKAQQEAAAKAEADARATAEAEADARAKAEADKAADDAMAKTEADAPARADGGSAAGQPVFDVAEVNPDGMMVVAGVAAPGAEVRLVAANGDVLARTIAGADGAFAFLPESPLPVGDSALRLEASDGSGGPVFSEETVVVSRSDDGAAPLIVLQSDDATQPSKVLQRPAAEPTGAVARLDDKADAGKSGVMADDKPVKTEDSGLAVGAIDYDSSGRLAVRGVAPPGSDVTVEVDGAPVAKTKADAAGDWTATTGAGAADGASRIDATAESKDRGPTARPLRVSLPFAPAGIIQDFPQGRMVVVQPGNSLWRIARRTYGEGLRYTVIYSANRGQIRNPDLIYPGQILHAPKPREG